jgi:hypothetical protein
VRAVRLPVTRLTGALAALALGITLTACGSDEPQAGEDPNAAADSTSTEPSAATDPSDEPATDEPSTIDDGAEVDAAEFVRRLQAGIDRTKYAHLEFTMSGAGGEMNGTGDVDYTVQPPNMQMTMKIGPQSIAMLLVDKVVYVQSSQAGRKYLEYDLSDPTNPLGADLADQLDPASSIEGFVKAVTSVTSAGTEDVDGRNLDRYVLTVDTTKLADQASTEGLPPGMKITVWLDGQGRMAKSTMDMGAIQYDATLSDFDKRVELEAPPADQVATPPGS